MPIIEIRDQKTPNTVTLCARPYFLCMLPQKRKQILRGLLFSVMCYLNYKKENNQCYLWQKSKQNSPKTFNLYFVVKFGIL